MDYLQGLGLLSLEQGERSTQVSLTDQGKVMAEALCMVEERCFGSVPETLPFFYETLLDEKDGAGQGMDPLSSDP